MLGSVDDDGEAVRVVGTAASIGSGEDLWYDVSANDGWMVGARWSSMVDG